MGFDKRGQLTIFVIVALVVVIAIAGYFVVNNFISDKKSDEYFSKIGEVGQLKDNIEGCIDDLSREGINYVGLRGGYYELPERYYEENGSSWVYYYYEGENIMPSLDVIEGQIGYFVLDNFEECLGSNYGSLDVTFSEGRGIVGVEEDGVFVELDVSVYVSSEGYKMTIDASDYSAYVNYSVFQMYDIAKFLTESHEVDSVYYPMSDVLFMAEEYDLYVDLYDVDEKTNGVIISDNSTDDGSVYYYVFLNKYTGDEVSNLENADLGFVPSAPEADE